MNHFKQVILRRPTNVNISEKQSVNNCYFHASFIETELTATTDGKQTCQGYDYLAKTGEQNQQFNKRYADFERQKQCTTELYGALYNGFFDCEKLLVPGVTIYLRFFCSPKNAMIFMKESDHEAKAFDGKVQANIGKASVFVRKVVFTDSVKLSIEKALV